MLKNVLVLIFCAAFFLFFGGAVKNSAQTPMDEPMVGDYRRIAVTDSPVVAAAAHAVKARAKKQRNKIKLLAVSQAEKQVVAGTNFRLCLQIEILPQGNQPKLPQTVQAIVFLNLKQKFTLTDWAIAACAEEILPIALPTR